MEDTMNLIDITKTFAAEEACLDLLEHLRWPDGVRCLKCGSEKLSRITRKSRNKNRRVRLFQCLSCDYQFTPTTGTIFADSHLPLTKWFLAVGLMINAKKGLSAKQTQRDLGVGYQTAWYLCHRIRKAMEEGDLPKFTGIVEVDETYVGGKARNMHKDVRERKITGTGGIDKAPVFGIIQRGGKVEAYSVRKVKKAVLVGKINDRVSTEAEMIVSDELKSYDSLGKSYRHEVINHIREWVRGNVHTNTMENFWSLFKRGLMGSFHKVSVKHLPRYLAEFTYRFNNRQAENLFVQTLAKLVLTVGMPYKNLVTSE
jgi:transposase-like protein